MNLLSAALFAFAPSRPAIADVAVLPNDTIRETAIASDSLPPLDSVIRARNTIDFGGGLKLVIFTWAIEVGLTTAPNPCLRNQFVATMRLRFTRRPDSLNAEFPRRVSTNERIARVDVEIPAASDGRSVVIHLADVQVASTRLTSNGDDVALRQQALALVERQLADWTPFEEEVVLAAVHAEAGARPPAP